MKPFDLEAARRGEPIQYRDGTPAKFVAFEPEARHPLVVLVEKYISTRLSNGKDTRTGESSRDIVMAPKKRTVWVNFYGPGACWHYMSEEDADGMADLSARLGGRAYPVEIEE